MEPPHWDSTASYPEVAYFYGSYPPNHQENPPGCPMSRVHSPIFVSPFQILVAVRP